MGKLPLTGWFLVLKPGSGIFPNNRLFCIFDRNPEHFPDLGLVTVLISLFTVARGYLDFLV